MPFSGMGYGFSHDVRGKTISQSTTKMPRTGRQSHIIFQWVHLRRIDPVLVTWRRAVAHD